ncbi:serine-rich adhesin for platelets-like [Ptychodera flava]|uniref:serine-rich adhesin for platelets-like n=1 Tax=Ptychodera flava TaxID=63121 RepID=UPI00396AA116
MVKPYMSFNCVHAYLLFYEQIECDITGPEIETAKVSSLTKLKEKINSETTASDALGRLASLVRSETVTSKTGETSVTLRENESNHVNDTESMDVVGEANKQLAALASLVRKKNTDDEETKAGDTSEISNTTRSSGVRKTVIESESQGHEITERISEVTSKANCSPSPVIHEAAGTLVENLSQLNSEKDEPHVTGGPLIKEGILEKTVQTKPMSTVFHSSMLSGGDSPEYLDENRDIVGEANQQLAAIVRLVKESQGNGHYGHMSIDNDSDLDNDSPLSPDSRSGTVSSARHVSQNKKTKNDHRPHLTSQQQGQDFLRSLSFKDMLLDTHMEGESSTRLDGNTDIVGEANKQLAAIVRLVQDGNDLPGHESQSRSDGESRNVSSARHDSHNKTPSSLRDSENKTRASSQERHKHSQNVGRLLLKDLLLGKRIDVGSSASFDKNRDTVAKTEQPAGCVSQDEIKNSSHVTSHSISEDSVTENGDKNTTVRSDETFENQMFGVHWKSLSLKDLLCKGHQQTPSQTTRETSANETLQQFAALAKVTSAASGKSIHCPAMGGLTDSIPSTPTSQTAESISNVINAFGEYTKVSDDVKQKDFNQESSDKTLAAVKKMTHAVKKSKNDTQSPKHPEYRCKGNTSSLERDSIETPACTQNGAAKDNIFSASLQMLQIAKLGSQTQPSSVIASNCTSPAANNINLQVDNTSMPLVETTSESISESFQLTIPDDLQRCIPGNSSEDVGCYDSLSSGGDRQPDSYHVNFNAYGKESVTADNVGPNQLKLPVKSALTGEFSLPASYGEIKISNVKSLRDSLSCETNTSNRQHVSNNTTICDTSDKLPSIKTERDNSESMLSNYSSPSSSLTNDFSDQSNKVKQNSVSISSASHLSEKEQTHNGSRLVYNQRQVSIPNPANSASGPQEAEVMDKRKEVQILGIDSYPNASFVNAVLQVFRHCPPLSDYVILLKEKHKSCQNSPCMLCQLYDVVNADSFKSLSKSAGALFNSLKSSSTLLKSSIVDLLENTYTTIVQSISSEIGSCGVCVMRVKRKTFCKSYQHFEESDDEMFCIPLSTDDSQCLQDSLDKFFTNRDVKSLCKQCPRSRAKRFVSVLEAPKCLAVSVNNSDGITERPIPAQDCVYLKGEQSLIHYDLRVVIATSDYHHNAYIRGSSSWMKVDDGNVTKMSFQHFQDVNWTTSMLFYVRNEEETYRGKRISQSQGVGHELKKIKTEPAD